jgi:glucan phosphoethanolaminetransferase (alkaline phosphatase superfamily)
MKMSLLLLLIGNAYILIVCLVGATTCFFRSRWKWFWLLLACVIVSSMCIGIALDQWLMTPSQDFPGLVRPPTTPL